MSARDPVSPARLPAGPARTCEATRNHGTSRVVVVERHHVLPVGWGGSPSTAEADHGTVWVWLCGNCHNTVHHILDAARKTRVLPPASGYPRGAHRVAATGWVRFLAWETASLGDVAVGETTSDRPGS